eukprot:410879_1
MSEWMRATNRFRKLVRSNPELVENLHENMRYLALSRHEKLKRLTGYVVTTSDTAKSTGLSILRSQSTLRRLVGYCPQNGPLIHHLTPCEHLTIRLFWGRSSIGNSA